MFRENGTTVFLEWKPEPGVTHTANAYPSPPLISTESTRIQLILLYNIVYNVSIIATLHGMEWEPNPNGVECKGKSTIASYPGLLILFNHEKARPGYETKGLFTNYSMTLSLDLLLLVSH